MTCNRSRDQAPQTRAARVWIEHGYIWLDLIDGRQVGISMFKFPRLRTAFVADVANTQIAVNGKALRWEELDEDLLVEGIVAGRFPA